MELSSTERQHAHDAYGNKVSVVNEGIGGNTLTMHNCAICATPVYAQSSARPQFMTFRLGFLDEGHGLAPSVAIWTEEMPAWAKLDPEMDSWPRQPPPPPRAD